MNPAVRADRVTNVVWPPRESLILTDWVRFEREEQLAKNDSILVDGIIAQRVSDGIPSSDKGEAFEYFSFEQILKNYDLSEEEIDTGWVTNSLIADVVLSKLTANCSIVQETR